MSEKVQPDEVLATMVEDASADDLKALGNYSLDYAEGIADVITPDTLDAFIEGAAVINLLVQEVVLNALAAAGRVGQAADTESSHAYVDGLRDGVMGVCTLLDAAAHSVLGAAIEKPYVEREFAKITEGIA